MPYNQYTFCVEPKSYQHKNQYVIMVIEGVIAGLIAGLIALAVSEPWCLLIAVEIAAIMTILGYCHWWLEDRLVCLGGDEVAIGLILSVEPPGAKTGFDKFDTDYSINLLLPPGKLGDENIEESVPYGRLIKEQEATKKKGLAHTGYWWNDDKGKTRTPVLHAEFEGAGVKDLLLGTQIALGLAVVALIVCVGIPGPWGALLAAILACLAFLAGLIGGEVGLRDRAAPEDIDPSLGTVSPYNTNPLNADIVGVYGRWVYDASHLDEDRGWNEIHAIMLCAKISKWKGSWPDDIGKTEKEWYDKVYEANSPKTKSQQLQPENRWNIHPCIDGCKPKNKPPPIR
jgi:hypothetical protein